MSELHDMKKVEIITGGAQLEQVKELLAKLGATGYTIIPNISGMGHHGVRTGHLMFNETTSLAMLISVVPEDLVKPIHAGLMPLFERHSGVLFVSDVLVGRPQQFAD